MTKDAQQEFPFAELEIHTTTGNELNFPVNTIPGNKPPNPDSWVMISGSVAPCACSLQSLMREGCKCGGI